MTKQSNANNNCCSQRRVGFECVQYYTDEGVPDPAQRKRDAISMTRRQDDIAANEPFPAVDRNEPTIEVANILPSPPATAEVAMELGGTRDDKPQKASKRAEWTCSPEFEVSQGGRPRGRPPDFQPYSELDENDGDTYDDLTVPDGWTDDYYWTSL